MIVSRRVLLATLVVALLLVAHASAKRSRDNKFMRDRHEVEGRKPGERPPCYNEQVWYCPDLTPPISPSSLFNAPCFQSHLHEISPSCRIVYERWSAVTTGAQPPFRPNAPPFRPNGAFSNSFIDYIDNSDSDNGGIDNSDSDNSDIDNSESDNGLFVAASEHIDSPLGFVVVSEVKVHHGHHSHHSGLSGWAIALIVIGGVMLLCAILLAAIVLVIVVRRLRLRAAANNNNNNNYYDGGSSVSNYVAPPPFAPIGPYTSMPVEMAPMGGYPSQAPQYMLLSAAPNGFAAPADQQLYFSAQPLHTV